MQKNAAWPLIIGAFTAGKHGDILGFGLTSGAADRRVQHADSSRLQPRSRLFSYFHRKRAGFDHQDAGTSRRDDSISSKESVLEGL